MPTRLLELSLPLSDTHVHSFSLFLSLPAEMELASPGQEAEIRVNETSDVRGGRKTEGKKEGGRRGRRLSEWSPIDGGDDGDMRERESPTHFVCAPPTTRAPRAPRIASPTSRRRRHCLLSRRLRTVMRSFPMSLASHSPRTRRNGARADRGCLVTEGTSPKTT